MFTLDMPAAPCKVPYMDLQKQQDTARRRLVTYGEKLRLAQSEVDSAKAELRSMVRGAAQDGLTEVEIAQLSGVSRPTVRDWLGKKT